MKLNRRDLIKGTAGLAAAGALTACAPASGAHPKGHQSSLMGKSKGNRVVIIGGGWGGTSTARSLRKHNPKAEIVLIEKNHVFSSCPMSNLYLGGLMPLYYSDYSALQREGTHVMQDVVTNIDRSSRMVYTANGSIDYDFLVLSPGIDYMLETIEGLAEARPHVPIGWRSAAGHIQLKRALDNVEEGNIIVGIPKGPIRCPPGPYERVAMIAHHVKKNKLNAKVVVLDANAKPMSKGPGFLAAYKELYGNIVEYHASHEVEAIDHNAKTVQTSMGDFEYEMANIIPQLKAGELIRIAEIGDRWADVHGIDMRSMVDDRIYVVGDSIGNQGMPKSGYMANSVGKVAGHQIALRMMGKSPADPQLSNTCFSTVDGHGEVGKAIKVSHSFTLDKATGKWSKKGEADLNRSEPIARAGREWADGIWYDMFGDA